MPIGIFDLAQTVRKKSASIAAPVQLGHAQQFIVAALGYKSLAAYQAEQRDALEPEDLGNVHHVVIDCDRLEQRASKLGTVPSQSQLLALIKESFQERSPRTYIHVSHADFENYLRAYVDTVVSEDDDVNREMANASYDGIDEVYFDFEVELESVAVGSQLEIDLAGHVGLGGDTERPYTGHIVNVEGFLAVERLGLQSFGSVICEVTQAKLDTNWGEDDHDREPPPRSISQAYADLLCLELHEVGDLADVEAIELDGNSGEMIYGYLLDVTEYASPEVARKILRHHSSLRIEVGPAFFEGVRSDDWPH